MNTFSTFRKLLALAIVFTHAVGWAQTKITYDVTALIDVADLLILRGSQVQWHHPNRGAAVGRHAGRNEATKISCTTDGVTSLPEAAWISDWPDARSSQIRHEALSSVISNIAAPLPVGGMKVSVAVLDGRGSVSVEQVPDDVNDWTLIVRFADGFSGSAFLNARISVEFVPLRLTVGDSSSMQARWPTNATGFHLETAEALSPFPSEWVTVTNAPVVSGQDFVVPIDATEPQRYFRLRRSN